MAKFKIVTPAGASFTVSGSINGNSYCFNITCANGCISSATPCSSAQLARMLREGMRVPAAGDSIVRRYVWGGP